jgi:hypothetical protein
LKLTKEGQEIITTTNDEKANMLAKTFFPPRPSDNALLQYVYPSWPANLTQSQRNKSEGSRQG